MIIGGCVLAAIVAFVVAGTVWKFQSVARDAREGRVEQCQRVVREFSAAKNIALPYDEAMAELRRLRALADTGIAYCKAAEMNDAVAGLEAAKVELERQQSAAQQADGRATQDAANAKKVNAWRPRVIKGLLADATTATNAGRWAEASAILKTVKTEIESVRGTTVESTPEWLELHGQFSTLEERVRENDRTTAVGTPPSQGGDRCAECKEAWSACRADVERGRFPEGEICKTADGAKQCCDLAWGTCANGKCGRITHD
jgi:hypothetical protein